MSDPAAIPWCMACGAEMPAHLLACPVCQQLVHAERLSALAAEASAAEQSGDLSSALAAWRSAANLLPAETSQFTAVQQRIAQLSTQIDQPGAATTVVSSPPHQSQAGKAAAGLGVVGMLFWKFKVVLFFILTKGKLLLLGLTKSSTLLSMFVAFAAYWTAWGWPFALGFIICMYIHEMGHVDALRRYGIKATAPMFIPGLGAFVRLQQHPASPAEDARIGLAGPIWGTAAAVACHLIYLATHIQCWAAIAHTAAFLNVFNLLPISPLDGGRGFRALSRHQGLLVTAAFGGAWMLSEETFFLLNGIVALMRSVGTRGDAPSDRTAFVRFLLLIATLAAIIYFRGIPAAAK